MSKPSVNYEFVLVIDPTIGEEPVKALVEKFQTLISENGELVSVDDWGVRKLAYNINFKSEGHYTLYTFTTDKADFNAELERVAKITDNILRWLVVRKEK